MNILNHGTTHVIHLISLKVVHQLSHQNQLPRLPLQQNQPANTPTITTTKQQQNWSTRQPIRELVEIAIVPQRITTKSLWRNKTVSPSQTLTSCSRFRGMVMRLTQQTIPRRMHKSWKNKQHQIKSGRPQVTVLVTITNNNNSDSCRRRRERTRQWRRITVRSQAPIRVGTTSCNQLRRFTKSISLQCIRLTSNRFPNETSGNVLLLHRWETDDNIAFWRDGDALLSKQC